MDPAPVRRWNPGFIALRWRHLFWGLPLLGLLAGLVVHFLPMIRGTATGVVQIRPGALTGSSAAHVSPHAFPRVADVIGSDEVLRASVRTLDLAATWQMSDEECIAELRETTRWDFIRGTALIEITVRGRNRGESRQIWDTLVTTLTENLNDARDQQDRATLNHLKAAVDHQKANADTARHTLIDAIRTENLVHDPSSLSLSGDKLETLKAEFGNAQSLLESMKIRLISESLRYRATDSVLVHQAPGTPVPVTLWDTLRPLVLHSSIGLGSGMVLAVVLAYLLELLFPRKTSAS